MLALAGGGGHHHHGGGGWGGWPGYWGGYGYPYPSTELVVLEPNQAASDDDTKTRALAMILALPKSQRMAAYKKVFGRSPPPGVLAGALGDFTVGSVVIPTWVAALGAAAVAYYVWKKMKGRR